MNEEASKPHSHEELQQLYLDSEQCDKEIFAEERSNLLLIAGEHYNKRRNEFYRRVRDSKELSEEQKLRLTKNHIQKIVKTYVNNIISVAPGVGFEPKNGNELQDQKAAELNHAVWQDLNDKHRIQTELIDLWADDYIGIGEVAVKIFWDPDKGKIKAYNQKTDESGANLFLDPSGAETAEPHTLDPMSGMATPHQLAPDYQSPVYSGGFIYDTIQGFNLLRAADCKVMDESPYLVYRKMVDVEWLKKRFGGDDETDRMFTASVDETMVVFDANKAGYYKAGKQVMVREFYFRPCYQYPRGYIFFTTKSGIFWEGELPGGIFPIVYRYCERIPTSPRGRSIVKTMRPYQAEINRSASKIAEHQITLGDDKLAIMNGTKLSTGAALPGIRGVYYTGTAPTHIPGRDGSQYLDYMNSQIDELYRVMNVMEDTAEKAMQLDPYTLLYRSASQKKAFQRYIRGFERFLIDIATTSLELARIHLPEDAIVAAIGKPEQINIPEFKNSNPLSYQIKITAQTDDIETKLGKQLVMNHILQYTGQKLDKEDIGKLIGEMPYANVKDGFSDLTMEWETANNIILELDRGGMPEVQQYDEHPYVIRRLVARKRQADFKFLDPQIQQNYAMQIDQHEQAESIKVQQLQRAEAGFIPTGGYMVVCDIYVPDPANPDKTQRARIPYESIAWLIKNLELQGQTLPELEKMNQGALAEMANHMGPQGMMAPRQGASAPPLQQPRPGGQPSPAMAHPGQTMPVGAQNGGLHPQGNPGQPPSGNPWLGR